MWHRVSTFNCAAFDYIVCGLTNIWPHSSPTLEIHLGGWTGASESGSGKEPLFHQAAQRMPTRLASGSCDPRQRILKSSNRNLEAGVSTPRVLAAE